MHTYKSYMNQKALVGLFKLWNINRVFCLRLKPENALKARRSLVYGGYLQGALVLLSWTLMGTTRRSCWMENTSTCNLGDCLSLTWEHLWEPNARYITFIHFISFIHFICLNQPSSADLQDYSHLITGVTGTECKWGQGETDWAGNRSCFQALLDPQKHNLGVALLPLQQMLLAPPGHEGHTLCPSSRISVTTFRVIRGAFTSACQQPSPQDMMSA